MIGRRGTATDGSLPFRERLVEQHAARRQRADEGGKQVTLQVAHDHDKREMLEWQRMPRQVGAPAANNEASRRGTRDGAANRVHADVHAERAEPLGREHLGVAASSNGDIERALRRAGAADEPANPVGHEPRRWIGRVVIAHTLVAAYRPEPPTKPAKAQVRGGETPRTTQRKSGILAQALVTSVGIGLVGLIATAVCGLTDADLSRHIALGFFSSLVILLAHSMMMFYFIGKGKAVKDAMAEGQLSGDHYRRIAVARKPVFSIGTIAMAVTMTAAILGGGVDTGVLPPMVHATIAYGAIVANIAACKVELDALGESGRIVDEVNRLLGL